MGRPAETFTANLVALDHHTSSRLASEHLLSRGHKRIGIIPGPQDRSYTRGRVAGWREALTRAGLSPLDDYVRFAEYSSDDGASAASLLFDLLEPPTAVLAGNFHLVVGVLRAMRQRRIERSRIEIMSSHDAEVLDEFTPPISSVEQPFYEMGMKAAELLLRQLRQPGCPPQQILLRPRLHIRT
jgi:DNA-binding LacI/PurR family transcriptional regulator